MYSMHCEYSMHDKTLEKNNKLSFFFKHIKIDSLLKGTFLA